METFPPFLCNDYASQMYSPLWGLGQNHQQHQQDYVDVSNDWPGLVKELLQIQSPPVIHDGSNNIEPAADFKVSNAAVKKLSHNANERQRRKKLNVLYSQLRSLLPNTIPRTKLSIPTTICQVVKYIPELLSQIENLRKRRDKLLAISSGNATSIECMQNSAPVVTISAEMGSNEVVITISTCKAGFLFSKVLGLVEEEGLDIRNAASFVAGEEHVFYSLHIQMRRGMSDLDAAILREQILMVFGERKGKERSFYNSRKERKERSFYNSRCSTK